MSCSYKVNDEYIKEVDAFLQYLDASSPEARTEEDIYKVMRSSKVLNRYKGKFFVTKYNKFDIPVQGQNLKILNIINGAIGSNLFIIEKTSKGKSFYQGFLQDTHRVKINPGAIRGIEKATQLMSVKNRYIAEKVEELSTPDSKLSPEEVQRLAEEYAEQMTDAFSPLRDDYLESETARLEQEERNTRFSKISQREKETMESAASKIAKLKAAFNAVGIKVDVVFDNNIEGFGEVDTSGENPVIRLNPETFRTDTVYHEFGHLFVDLLGIDNPLVQEALKQIRNSDVLEEVQIKYPELTQEEAEMEALVTVLGRKAADKASESQSKLMTIIRKIIRAIGKLFGISPDATVVLAERLFAGEIKKEDLQGSIERDTIRLSKAKKTAAREVESFDNLVAKLKADTFLKIKDAESRLEERLRKKGKGAVRTAEDSKELSRLKFLREKLEAAKKVEDLIDFAKQAQAYAKVANKTFANIYKNIPAPGETLTADQSLQQIRSLMTTKNYLDSFWNEDPKKSILSKLKTRVLNKIEAQESRNRKPGKELISMRKLISDSIDEMEKLNNDFERLGLPLLADYIYNFHNPDIDVQMQKIIENLESNQRSAFIDKTDPKYQELKKRKNTMSYQEYEKELSKVAVEQIKNKIPSKQTLIRDLTSAHRDKSTFSHYFDPMIYSSNVAIQLMAIAIKSKYLTANEDTRITSFKVGEAYDKFAEATGKTDINSAAFNEGLFERVQVMGINPKNDERTLMTVKSFVQPTRAGEFMATKTQFYKDLNKKWGKPKTYDADKGSPYQLWLKSSRAKQYYKEEAEWFASNTVKTNNADKIIKNINLQIANLVKRSKNPNLVGTSDMALINAEINRLKSEKNKLIYTKPDGTIVYKNKLAKPNGKWANPKFKAMSKAQKDYYNVLLETYKEHQAKVASSSLKRNPWDEFSYILPSIRIDMLEAGGELGIAKTFKDLIAQSTEALATDIDYGILKDINGEILKSIPIFYTNLVDADMVSSDLASSVMRFVHMANMYEQKSNVLAVVNLSLDIVEGINVPETNALGMPLISQLLKKFGASEQAATETISGKQTNLFQSYQKFIDVVMFGQVDTQKTINFLGKELDQNKLARSLTTYTALNTLAFNFLQAGAQGLYDNFTATEEALAGEYYSPQSMAEAYGIYWSNTAAMSDLGSFTAKTKLGQWVQYFDALVEFSEEATRTRGGTKVKKVVDTSTLMSAQAFIEHSLQTRRSLALALEMKGKLKDKNGKVIMNAEGKPASLWDVFIEVKPGIFGVDPKVANFNKLQFITRHHGLSRRTNQTKGLFDRALIQREAGGKLLMLYKNWVVPGIRRRFGHGDGLHVDEELGTVTEGMYMSFWRMIQKAVASKDINQFTDEYNKMTSQEKANVVRTLSEIGGFVGTFVLIGLLMSLVPGMDDDDADNDPYYAQYMIYQLRRFRTEISAYANPLEAWRLIKSPTATVRPVSNLLNLVSHAAFKGVPYIVFNKGLGIEVVDEKDVIQQRDGLVKKGEAKINKYFLKAGFKGFLTATNPGDALKFFDAPSEF